MNLLRIINRFAYKRYYNNKNEWDLDTKISFLKKFNLCRGEMFSTCGFCIAIRSYRATTFRDLKPSPAIIHFPEIWEFEPFMFFKGYWFPLNEKGFNKRHNICNILLGELEEKQKEQLQNEF
jgi:hypothetical protein